MTTKITELSYTRSRYERACMYMAKRNYKILQLLAIKNKDFTIRQALLVRGSEFGPVMIEKRSDD